MLRGHGAVFDPDAVAVALTSPLAFPASGGNRLAESQILDFRQRCISSIDQATAESGLTAGIDLALGRELAALGALSHGEMGVAGVWDFLTLIVLPDIAWRRIGATAEEVAGATARSRLTGGDRRHVLQRLWKRRAVFGDEIVESRQLTEDDYVATLERRITLEHPKLARLVAERIVSSGFEGSARREYTRLLMRRLVQLSGIIHLDDTDEGHLKAALTQLHHDSLLTLESQSSR